MNTRIKTPAVALYDAVERAAEKLPPDYIVRIDIERHGYGVELISPNGCNYPFRGDGIVTDIRTATNLANSLPEGCKHKNTRMFYGFSQVKGKYNVQHCLDCDKDISHTYERDKNK